MIQKHNLWQPILLALCLSIATTTHSIAQNLVLNPSFENATVCPIGLNGITNGDANNWMGLPAIPTCNNTADYFNSCNGGIVSTPNNNFGFQAPHTGDAYAGVLGYDSNNPHCRSYLSIELDTPLEIDSTYCVSFRVSLADFTDQAIAQMGAYFSNANALPVWNTLPHVSNTTGVLADKTGWVTISGTFTADQAYPWLILGNFFADTLTTVFDLSSQGVSSQTALGYYYIDDVSVERLEDVTTTFEVNGDGNIQAFNDTALVCIGDSVQFTVSAEANSSFSWTTLANPFDTINITNQLDTLANVDQAYIVTTVDSVCARRDTIFLDVALIPTVNFSADVLCFGYNTLFTDFSTDVIPGALYEWDFEADGTIDANTQGGGQYIFPAAGVYEVALTITNVGTCVATDTIEIEILANCDPCAGDTFIQNIVPNPSIEIYSSCADSLSGANVGQAISNVTTNWYQPTDATSDYYNACNNGDVSVPANAFGSQNALDGQGYLGFYAARSGDYREYVGTNLLQTLTAGKNYCVSFNVSLADSVGKAVDNIGLYFSNGPVVVNTQAPLGFLPHVNNPSLNILSDKTNWTEVSGVYTATGAENYITIGNFFSNANTSITDLPGTFAFDNDAYYYLDGVVITEMPDLLILSDTATSQEPIDSVTLCVGDTANVFASGDFCDFTWRDVTNNIVTSTDSTLLLTSSVSGVRKYAVSAGFGSCAISDTLTVYYAPISQPNFSVVANCAGAATVFLDGTTDVTSTMVFTWIFGDGDTLVTSAGIVPHIYTSAGNYDVQLVVLDSITNCGNSITINYDVTSECDPCNNENNLVWNGSFEDVSACPDTTGQIQLADFWLPEQGDTANLFNMCDVNGNAGVPQNLLGNQAPYEGDGYAGITLYSDDGFANMVPTDNQFITGQTTFPLDIGQVYCFKMYVSLADSSSYAVDEISALFTNTPPNLTPGGLATNYQPQIVNPENITRFDKNGWVEISGNFTAASAYQYLTIGNFEVNRDSFNITYLGGDLAGFAHYYIDDVSVVPMDLEILNQDVAICEGDSTTLFATTNTCDHYWIEAGSPNNILGTDTMLTVSPDTTTTYVFVGSNGNQCTITDSITVRVFELPSFVSLISDSTICAGQNVELFAGGGDSILWSSNSAFSDTLYLTDYPNGDTTFVVSPNDTTTYYVRLFDENTGCTFSDSVRVFVNPLPNALIGTLDTISIDTVRICLGDSIRLIASGGDIYQWAPTDSVSNDTIPDPFVMPSDTLLYNVLVRNSLTGCVSETSIVVAPQAPYIVPANDTLRICAGDSAVINLASVPSDAVSYSWFPQLALSDVTSATPTTFTTTDILYTVIYTDSIGCSGQASVFIDVKPVVSAGPDISICENGVAQLNATPGALSYLWSPSIGLNDTTIANPTAQPSVTTTYVVEAVFADSLASCPRTDTITVFVNPTGFANAGPDQVICAGDTVQLNAIGGDTYAWSPNVAISDTTLANPDVFPTSDMTYIVEVTSNITGCTSFDTVEVVIKAESAPVIADLDTLYCADPFTPLPICLDITYNGCEALDINVISQLNSNILVLNNNCFEYTSAFSTARTDTIEVQVCAGALCDTVSTVILDCDLPPAWPKDTIQRTVCQNTITTITLPMPNDPDADDVLTISSETPPSGTVNITNGDFIYTPASNFIGLERFFIYVCDSLYPSVQFSGLPANVHCDTLEIFVDVRANADPTTNNLVLNMLHDQSASGCLTIGDADGDVLSTTIGTPPSNGTLTFDSLGCVTYTPNPGFFGTDAATVEVCDLCKCTTANLTFNVINNPPVANDTTVTTPFETPIQVCLDITEPDGDIINSTIQTLPSNGTATLNGDTCVSYTPNNGFAGQDIVEVVVCDTLGLCDTATVTINVLGQPNNPPVVNDTLVTTPFETPITVCPNIIEPDGDVTTLNFVTSTTNGALGLDANGCVTYTPNNGFIGLDSTTIVVCDPLGACDTATITIQVLPSTPPIVPDTCVTTSFNTPVFICIDITDPEGDDANIVSILAPPNGSVSLANDSCFVYIQNLNFVGTDTIDVTVCDDNGSCTLAEVCVIVEPLPNQPPTVLPVDTTTTFETPLQICLDIAEPEGEAFTLDITSGPVNGSVTVDNDTCLTYTPANGFIGTDIIQVRVCDINNNCSTTTVTIQVMPPINDPPIAQDTCVMTNENVPIQVCLDITEPDGDAFNIAVTAGPFVGGTVIVNNDSCLTYTPPANFVGRDSVEVAICDVFGNCDTVIVCIDILPVNSPPVVNDTTVTTPFETPLDVCLNIFDPDNDTTFAVTIIVPPNNGTANNNPADSTCITYTPQNGFSGDDTIQVQVCDPLGACDTATIFITVQPPGNMPPIVEDTIVTTPTSVPIRVCLDITEPDGDGFDLAVIDGPFNGGVTVDGDSCIIYTSDPTFSGLDSVEVIVCDDFNLCDTATVFIDVTPVNQPPIVNDTTVNTLFETPIQVCLNITEPEGETFAITNILIQPSMGTVTIDNNSCITYTPDAGFTGIDTITVQVCDNSGNCSNADVFVVVSAQPNAPPIVNDTMVTTNFQTPIQVCLAITEPDGDAVTLSVNNGPFNGSISVQGDTCITYSPSSGFVGQDSIEVFVCDNFGACDTATVFISVNPAPNLPPVANDTTVTTPFETDITVCLDITEPNNDVYTVTITNAPSNGSASISGDCVTYMPNNGFIGTDQITVEVCDDAGLCDEAIITINVSASPNNPPTFDSTPPTEPVNPDSTIVLCTTASDPDGHDISFSVTNISPNEGTASVDANGCVTYTADSNGSGSVQITVEVCDDQTPPLCDETTITVVVSSPPEVMDTLVNIQQNMPTTICLDITDPDGDPYSLTETNAPDNGTATIDNADCFTYTPDPTFAGTDTIIFDVCDEPVIGFTNDCTPVMVVIVVGDVFEANDDAVSLEDCEKAFVYDFIDNDVYPITETLTISIINGPNSGSLDDDGSSGSITYTPNNGFTGNDTITYQIVGSTLGTDTAMIVLTVVNDLEAFDDTATTMENQPIDIDVLLNDTSPSGLSLGDIIITDGVDNGALTEISPGVFTYLPTVGFSGTDMFIYTINHPNVGCGESATVVITVDALPPVPQPEAEDDTTATTLDNGIIINVLGNDLDVNGGLMVDDITDDANNGTVTINADGTLTYTPNAGFFGTDMFSYTVIDSLGQIDTATVFVTISDINCEPFIYSALSPNGDNMNDELAIVGIDATCNTINNTLLIYNRWGNIVFEAENYGTGALWDGTFRGTGNHVPDGTYYYVLQIHDTNATLTGFIEVSR